MEQGTTKGAGETKMREAGVECDGGRRNYAGNEERRKRTRCPPSMRVIEANLRPSEASDSASCRTFGLQRVRLR